MSGGGSVSKATHIYIRRAYRWARIFSFIPFSRGYALAGSVYRGSAQPESDIDLIVIARTHFVWLHRALLFLFLALSGRRRTRRSHAGKFCIVLSVGEQQYISSRSSYNKHLWYGRSPLLFVEYLCMVTGLAFLAERVARYSIGRYIRNNFARYEGHNDAILRLSQNHIEYFPPRKKRTHVSGLSAHSYPAFPRI